MNYYVKDTTTGNLILKETVEEMVSHLEGMCKRFYKKPRTQFMDDMISIGYGYDDPNGAIFTEIMAQEFEIGVYRSDEKLVRTNIHEHARNSKYRSVMGD